ncbi:hypothetical protein [Microbacterium galbinum]|uniref:Uncharacterized protein n=1 Tax=Microbacterium galbinum TaxID=2851646 RepID=A0ABY4IJP2_9MICO|nr:hypothetical protein [Microbacterium galbinum]UPL12994.1 hypothetical protein KV396_00150 [Microbacterium galbinum]
MGEDLDRALDRLSVAEAERDAAQDRVAEAARAVAGAITGRSAGGAADRDLARVLYWDYPDVPVPVVGALLGVATNRVAGVVGGRVVERPCVNGCGRMATWTMRSRNESTSGSTECSTCAEERGDRGLPRGWAMRPAGS